VVRPDAFDQSSDIRVYRIHEVCVMRSTPRLGNLDHCTGTQANSSAICREAIVWGSAAQFAFGDRLCSTSGWSAHVDATRTPLVARFSSTDPARARTSLVGRICCIAWPGSVSRPGARCRSCCRRRRRCPHPGRTGVGDGAGDGLGLLVLSGSGFRAELPTHGGKAVP
jgi:hypothetical protein